MLVVYWRGLNTFRLHTVKATQAVSLFRSGSCALRNNDLKIANKFSTSSGNDEPSPSVQTDKATLVASSSTQDLGLSWLNIKAGILGSTDHRMPLPGNVGVKLPNVPKDPIIHLIADLPMASTATEFNAMMTHPKLTVERTEEDMSVWSSEVENERDILTHQFVETARNVCAMLNREGWWADFIDPSSGRPYYAPHTNDVFLETDDRYRYFGFTIEDLGCCKMISHRLFGTHVFVGAIFTSADLDNEVVKKILAIHGPDQA